MGAWTPPFHGTSLSNSPLSLGQAQLKQELAQLSPWHLPTALLPCAKLVFRVQRVPEKQL